MTQIETITRHLKRKYLTSWQAFELYGCTRLSSIVFKLINRGYVIKKKQIKVTTRYGAIVTVTAYKIEK